VDLEEPIEPNRTPAARRSSGGLLGFLGLIVPVVLGGLTVFGVYFFFLEDDLNKPKPVQNNETQPIVEPEKPDPTVTTMPKPTPANSSFPPKPAPAPIEKPAAQAAPAKSPEPSREAAAEKALGLAEKMWKLKPAAAPDWYRKVIERHPGTNAAEKAEAWLKQRGAEP